MNWYYSSKNQRLGPLDQKSFDQLVSRGEVKADTLVWREGMKSWAPYATVQSRPQLVQPILSNPDASVGRSCYRCGRSFAADELVALQGRNVCPGCKALELQSVREAIEEKQDSEAIRKEYIGSEASVKAVGHLFILGSTVLLILFAILFANVEGLKGQRGSTELGYIMLFSLPLSALHFWTGWGLVRLSRPARTRCILLSCIGLLGIPFGTLLSGIFLYLMLSKGGVMVFSDEYKRVIEETPHLKYRRSVLGWIALLLVIALILGFLYMIGNRTTE